MEGAVTDGCWVSVHHSSGKILGYGHYQNGSIAVRVLSFGEAAPNDDFYVEKLLSAYILRHKAAIISENTNAFRLIHGEGDGLPGLIVDYYDGVAIVQAHDVGMHLDRFHIAAGLQKVLVRKDSYGEGISAIYYKSQSTLPGKMRDVNGDEYLLGMGIVPHIVLEYGNKFYVDWEEGQKTGFFLDQ